MYKNVKFLKLGGSLITNKDLPYTVETGTLNRISGEIHDYISTNPDNRLIIGHGSGSFGHTSAALYKTWHGVRTGEDWVGFSKVCHDARSLNQLVTQALIQAGVPAISFPPSAQVTCTDHRITRWDTSQIEQSLHYGLVPVVFGDTVLDANIGGTILSTEELFFHLAGIIQPESILLAGIEAGVWMDFPSRSRLIPLITPGSYPAQKIQILESASPDVTGGMSSKIENMLRLVGDFPQVTIQVFAGIEPWSVANALNGVQIGTTIRNTERNPS
ncbi:MAG: hypothetical protein C0391_06540 [Anaerolinea sp.]|nr:hypothetical protein [Anaerolinea sp.]